MADRPKWLIFGIGNPSRGDDALGSEFIDRLSAWLERNPSLPMDVTLQTDFQCQIEHALDLVDMAGAVFIDASLSAKAPFEVTRLAPAFDATHTTHALSPACVLAVAGRLGQSLPPCWQLAIPGVAFDLGAAMSMDARDNLDKALDGVTASLTNGGAPLFV